MREYLGGKNHKRIVVIAVSIVSLLAAANLFVSNILATSGEHLKDLLQRKTNLLQQNGRLSEQVINLSALDSIELRAQELGLAHSNAVLSLTSQPPVAMNKGQSDYQRRNPGLSSDQSGSESKFSPRSAGNQP